ncbi:MAG TPA: hypothetical protein VET48_00680, partial [Steroidobacteraceae bacterium]|nr:hypothetical protein [Steroidobacteraceae bacterium]
ISHLGTRYRVRLGADALSVGVRDGKVGVTNSHGQMQAETGRELKIDNMGRVSEQEVAPFGMDWSWADALAPRFDIEGRSVKEFLAWAATETGRSVQYASTKVESAAVNTVLHGSSNSFAPTEAVAAILPTTDFVASFEGERLVISVR